MFARAEEVGEDVGADLSGALMVVLVNLAENIEGRGGRTPMRATLRMCVSCWVAGDIAARVQWL